MTMISMVIPGQLAVYHIDGEVNFLFFEPQGYVMRTNSPTEIYRVQQLERNLVFYIQQEI